MEIETILIHSCENNPLGAVGTPIFATSTFADAARHGYSYTRTSNPTREALEKTVAAAEGGRYGFAFSSGLAAEDALFACFDKIICANDTYGGTKRLLKTCYSASFCDVSDENALSSALTGTYGALVFAETPANPLMRVTDIGKTAAIAHAHNAYLAIDNTFLTPALQRPLSLGADAVVHSATKYLGGHHDSVAGCVATSGESLAEKLKNIINTKGNGLSPFESFLIKRGMETLALRMKKHCENAEEVFRYLKTRRDIKKIYYAGDPENEGYAVNSSQSSGAGGVISFEIDEEKVPEFIRSLKLIKFAESLGGNASLITHPFTQTHASLSGDEKAACGITKGLLRLSCGTESAVDIINDLERSANC